jgi:hypothetical protein
VKITEWGAPVPVGTDRERKKHKKESIVEARVCVSLSADTKQHRNSDSDKLFGPDVALHSGAK